LVVYKTAPAPPPPPPIPPPPPPPTTKISHVILVSITKVPLEIKRAYL